MFSLARAALKKREAEKKERHKAIRDVGQPSKIQGDAAEAMIRDMIKDGLPVDLPF